jgi:hypothetical protein
MIECRQRKQPSTSGEEDVNVLFSMLGQSHDFAVMVMVVSRGVPISCGRLAACTPAVCYFRFSAVHVSLLYTGHLRNP